MVKIEPVSANTFTITSSNNAVGKACWISYGTNLPDLTPLVYFPGTTNSYSVTVTNDKPQCFFGAASDAITVTNFLPSSFIPYPNQTNTNRPCQWQAYPIVTYNQVVGGFGQILSINGTNWFLFVHVNEYLEIRTVQNYTNPPVFTVGTELIIQP